MCKIVPRYALHHRVASSRSLYFLLSLSFALLFISPHPSISRKSLFLISSLLMFFLLFLPSARFFSPRTLPLFPSPSSIILSLSPSFHTLTLSPEFISSLSLRSISFHFICVSSTLSPSLFRRFSRITFSTLSEKFHY